MKIQTFGPLAIILAALFSSLSASALQCPKAYVHVAATHSTPEFCIMNQVNFASSETGSALLDGLIWPNARQACADAHAQLCSIAQWRAACETHHIAGLGLASPEWVSDLVPEGVACGSGGYGGRCAYTMSASHCDQPSGAEQISYDYVSEAYRCCI